MNATYYNSEYYKDFRSVKNGVFLHFGHMFVTDATGNIIFISGCR